LNTSEKNEAKKLIIMGAGAFARETLWVVNEIKAGYGSYLVIGFLDDDLSKTNSPLLPGSTGTVTRELKILGSLDSMLNSGFTDYDFVLPAVGTTDVKKIFTERLLKFGCKLPGPVVHRSAETGHDNVIGDGTIIAANSSITCNISVGRQVNINLNCTIGHDVIIEDYCNLSPDVNLSGNVHLSEGVTIGTGAVILPKVKIGCWSVIGAGAVVTKDIPPFSTAVGIPAKIIKSSS
jgi:sugar O-acyltransferase (sialic acid O-acetyltransferase NeuD family)